MTLTYGDASTSDRRVIDWLLDSDPSVRWQVMHDLTDTPLGVVGAERSRVATEGWGARLLDQQRPDGQWGDGVATPFWWSNMYTLVFLRDLDYLRAASVQPDERIDEAVAVVRERRQDDGRWLLDVRHRMTIREEMAGAVGEPNRWITLRALRVLAWTRST